LTEHPVSEAATALQAFPGLTRSPDAWLPVAFRSPPNTALRVDTVRRAAQTFGRKSGLVVTRVGARARIRTKS
jgi:hypothetical protein